jgi:sortase (surface protein transpeptidase)
MYKVHKTKTNNPEKLSTLDTQDEDKQSRETVNIRYTRHKTKTNNPEKLSTLDTQDEDKQSRETVNIR